MSEKKPFQNKINSLKHFLGVYKIAYLKNHLIDVYNWRESAPRLGEVIWIPLKDIRGFKPIGKWYHFSDKGTIITGNWDINIRPLEDPERLCALIKLYRGEEGAEEVFKNLYSKSKNTDNFIKNKAKRANNVFNSIKEKGFCPGKRFLGGFNTLFKDRSAIRVAITRKGEFVWVGSHHRLAAAIALKLEKVPVLVRWRHTEWQKVRKETKEKYKRGEIKKEDITHPDLFSLFNKPE